MRILAQAVDLGGAKEELELGEGHVWQSVHAPLDDARVEVAREVRKRPLWMHREAGEGQRWLLRLVDQLFVADVPHGLLRGIST